VVSVMMFVDVSGFMVLSGMLSLNDLVVMGGFNVVSG